MSDTRTQDPLYDVLFRALIAHDDLVRAFEAARACDALPETEARDLDWLVSESLPAAYLAQTSLKRIRTIFADLDDRIAHETRTEIVFDECCMSGSYEDSHVTDAGDVLLRLRRRLSLLAELIEQIHCHLSTAELLRTLRA